MAPSHGAGTILRRRPSRISRRLSTIRRLRALLLRAARLTPKVLVSSSRMTAIPRAFPSTPRRHFISSVSTLSASAILGNSPSTTTSPRSREGNSLSPTRTLLAAIPVIWVTRTPPSLARCPMLLSRCPYMVIPGYATPVPVLLLQSRGRFDSGVTRSSGKYHAAYINDSWALGQRVTVNLGLRWEQQRLIGNQLSKVFNDMWSPRLGFILDPKGNRKTKIYANFGRYAFILPLDAAVRALSAEDDVLGAHWAPASTTTGCPTGTPTGASCVVTDSSGNPDYANFFKPDAAHLLNQAAGGVGTAVNVGLSGGEPFQPGIRMEYTDEFVVGAQHELRNGIVLSARYIDRRLKRVIEDEGGISVEQFNALAANGGGLNYFIGNPNSKSDIFVNPNEQTFSAVDETPSPCAANNGDPLGTFDCALLAAKQDPSAGNAAALVALGFPTACIDSNNAPTPYVAPNVATSAGQVLGSGCFPAVDSANQSSWTIPNPNFDSTKPVSSDNPKR